MINLFELKNKIGQLYSILILEKCLNYRIRYFLGKISFIAGCFLLFLILVEVFLKVFLVQWLPEFIYLKLLHDYASEIQTVFLLFLVLWIIIKMLDLFFHDLYFSPQNKISFELAKILNASAKDDLVISFLKTKYGKLLFMRLGLSLEILQNFLINRKTKLHEIDFEIMNLDYYTISDYLQALYKLDQEWSQFLFQNSIDEKTFVGVTNWIKNIEIEKMAQGIWWSKENLVKIPSIGRNWSFGKVYFLEKYGHSIFNDKNYQNLGYREKIYQKHLDQIQNILLKSNSANVLIVAEINEIAMNVVSALAKILIKGKINTFLQNRRIFVLDGLELIDQTKEKISFENTFRKILIQANNAGNVILVIPKLSNLIESANNLGVDLENFLADSMSSSNIQIIALTDLNGYHQTIETNKNFLQNFDKVSIKQNDQNEILELLQKEAQHIEQNYKLFFSYRALEKIADATNRFFNEFNLESKVLDLLDEIKVKCLRSKIYLVTEKEVLEMLSGKMNISLGAITEQEKTKLNNLDVLLHRRVIGQENAIVAIVKAMKRARLDIQNKNRPIGSFLFIGPTGVGKTEVTKALAENFFGDEENIIRFDMSEFNSIDSVEKLIGFAGGKEAGILANKIRDNQFGILLLDEFEKAHSKVHDLFLQILDEGIFTDTRGQKINVRNMIIIATSNAGSDLIYEQNQNAQFDLNYKDQIVGDIIKQKIFKPELLNRFDEIILFHPLKREHLQKIVVLMLQKLQKRLLEKGVQIDIDEELIDYLITSGLDLKFGARAINRKIQDEIESQIADYLINHTEQKTFLLKFKINPQLQKIEISV